MLRGGCVASAVTDLERVGCIGLVMLKGLHVLQALPHLQPQAGRPSCHISHLAFKRVHWAELVLTCMQFITGTLDWTGGSKVAAPCRVARELERASSTATSALHQPPMLQLWAVQVTGPGRQEHPQQVGLLLLRPAQWLACWAAPVHWFGCSSDSCWRGCACPASASVQLSWQKPA